MRFEWDPNKNEINKRKHKVSFEEAVTVFYDEDAIIFDDPDHSDAAEERFLLLGFSSKSRMLIVCHCFREDNKRIRIISARKATTEEQTVYDEFKRGW
ncbi:MAG: BrnT family toxin [Erysipelotrichaceae bacterium]|nr:BrnT family toxin [Erysipelotrichaceae bacterium]